MTQDQLPPLPTPDGQMTVTFGIDEKRKVPVFFAERLTAYELAALAQQAQEPVAWMNDEGDVEHSHKPWMSSAWTPLYTAPPAPQVLAPVDERETGSVRVSIDLIRRAQQAINWHLEPNSPDEYEATMRELTAIGWPNGRPGITAKAEGGA